MPDPSAVYAIAAVIGCAIAGLMYANTKTLRETNGDLRDRVGDLEKDRAEDREKIAKLTSDNEALARVVTGEVHLQALLDLLARHHEESMEAWQAIRTAETRLLAAIEGRSTP